MAFQLGLARACRPTGLGREAVALTALAVVAPGLWPQAVLAAGAGAVEPLHVGPVPVDFVLFALIPLGIASFHHHTFNVAMMGLAAILADKLAVTGFKTGPGIPGLLGHLAH